MVDQCPFAGLPREYTGYSESRVAVLPVPFERTTSYGKGTARGPQAILEASQYLEWYDEELGTEPFSQGITTLAPLSPSAADLEGALDEIEAGARRHVENGKFLVALGGEHSLSLPLVRAARNWYGELGVVQFDAHADLRQEYEGTPLSHACVMRRILEQGVPSLAVGIRSLSRPEAELVRRRDLAVLWGSELAHWRGRFEDYLRRLPQHVYLTFDVDFFDPSLVPATGTPEPGGGTWYPTLAMLRTLFAHKTVVAMDVVELAPIPGQPASDFVVAKLVYKCVGYWSQPVAARQPGRFRG